MSKPEAGVPPETKHAEVFISAAIGFKPRIVTECDTYSSILIEVEAGHGIALSAPIFRPAAGKPLLYRRITGTTESLSAGIARAKNGNVTPAGEEFCEILRNVSNGATGEISPRRQRGHKYKDLKS